MKTPVEVSIADLSAGDLPYPVRVKELEQQICELRARIVNGMAVFREALREFAGQSMRETAKSVAVAQNQRTLALGRGEIAKLKRDIDEHIRTIEERVNDEFTVEKYCEAGNASSGQVGALIARRFEVGVRRILGSLGPFLERAGYARDENWIEPEPPEGQRGRYLRPLELPPDLADLIAKVAEAIADVKVAEAKITFYDKQRDKNMAAELWDNA